MLGAEDVHCQKSGTSAGRACPQSGNLSVGFSKAAPVSVTVAIRNTEKIPAGITLLAADE